MYTRHVEGRPRIINKIIALSKWHLPPCTPRIYGFSSYIEGQAGAPLALGSLCPPGFAPHYVAVQPGRCRRFIGTLLARIKYSPRTLRMEDKERRSESLAADLEEQESCGKQFRDRSCGKNCDESFQDFVFCDLHFLKFDFCGF